MSIPVQCTKCGTIFWSRRLSLVASTGSRIVGFQEPCIVPSFGGTARGADGIYDNTPYGVEILSGPDVSREMLAALRRRISEKRDEYTSIEELRSDIAAIHPSFSELVTTIRKHPFEAITIVLTIIQIWIALAQNKSIKVETMFYGPTTSVEHHYHSPKGRSLPELPTPPQPSDKDNDPIRSEAKSAVQRFLAIPKSKPSPAPRNSQLQRTKD